MAGHHPSRKPHSWEPKLRTLTPETRKELLTRIEATPGLLDVKKKPHAYKAFAEKVRRSKFYGYRTMMELLEHGIGVMPYKMKGKRFVPIHPDERWFAHVMQLQLERHPIDTMKNWKLHPQLQPLVRHAIKHKLYGYADWQSLLHAIKNKTFHPTKPKTQ